MRQAMCRSALHTRVIKRMNVQNGRWIVGIDDTIFLRLFGCIEREKCCDYQSNRCRRRLRMRMEGREIEGESSPLLCIITEQSQIKTYYLLHFCPFSFRFPLLFVYFFVWVDHFYYYLLIFLFAFLYTATSFCLLCSSSSGISWKWDSSKCGRFFQSLKPFVSCV